jgi:hypothetical protein
MYGAIEFIDLWVGRVVDVEEKLAIKSWRFNNG